MNRLSIYLLVLLAALLSLGAAPSSGLMKPCAWEILPTRKRTNIPPFSITSLFLMKARLLKDRLFTRIRLKTPLPRTNHLTLMLTLLNAWPSVTV